MENAIHSKRLLIAWHSRTGASEAMANAAAIAAAEHVAVDLCPAGETSADTMLAACAFLFVAPENLGGLSGAMKEMFDRAYYPLLGKREGYAYGSIIAAGSDGTGAQRQLDRIVTGWRLKRVVDPLIVNFDAQTPEAIMAPKKVPEEALENCRQIGEAMGAGVALGVF
ncbi:MAG: NAD(P)H-dependent oxidoreductase [Pseudomonadota bacterium]